jgi:hypothetical protein
VNKHRLWIAGLLVLAIAATGQTHELKANKQVGALMHIQPDDSPQVGVQTIAWFGLVKRGGEPVRLAECECGLSIYKGKAAAGKATVTPSLREGRVEGEVGNKDRLLADVTFPQAGPYTLVLTGKPKESGRFAPFKFKWVVRAT